MTIMVTVIIITIMTIIVTIILEWRSGYDFQLILPWPAKIDSRKKHT